MDKQTIEQLAEKQHSIWAMHYRYILNQGIENEDGSITLPAKLASKWSTESDKAYTDLDEIIKAKRRSETVILQGILTALAEQECAKFAQDLYEVADLIKITPDEIALAFEKRYSGKKPKKYRKLFGKFYVKV